MDHNMNLVLIVRIDNPSPLTPTEERPTKSPFILLFELILGSTALLGVSCTVVSLKTTSVVVSKLIPKLPLVAA